MSIAAAFATLYRANHGVHRACALADSQQYEASDVSDAEMFNILFTDEPFCEACNQRYSDKYC